MATNSNMSFPSPMAHVPIHSHEQELAPVRQKGDAHYIHTKDEMKDPRSTMRKVAAFFQALGREILYALSVLRHRRITPEINAAMAKQGKALYDNCEVDKAWQEKSCGLHVFIHGLKAHPSIWDGHIAEEKKINASRTDQEPIETYVPFVPKAGDCTLKEAGDPILKQVKSYIDHYRKKHPDGPVCPICLSGVSNGGRIATYIETQLRKDEKYSDVPVMVSTIAAVHYGTEAFDAWYSRFGGKQSAVIREELSFGSDTAKSLLDEVNAVPADFDVSKRKFLFFGTRDDWHVTHVGSTIPKINKVFKREAVILEGFMHSGVVKGARKKHLADAHAWLNLSRLPMPNRVKPEI